MDDTVPIDPWDTHRWMIEGFRERRIRLYGLTSTSTWLRYLAGVGESNATRHADGAVLESATSYELGHRARRDEEVPFVTVEVTHSPEGTPMPGLILPILSPVLDPMDLHPSRLTGPPSRQALLRVDGEEQSFRVLEDEHRFAASCRIDDIAVVCTGAGLPVDDVELEQVVDIGPYVDGYTAMLRAEVSPPE